MVHPTYTYGKDGYVFSHYSNPAYGAFHEAFADMVKELQEYCEARGVPFLFAFEPTKCSVLPEYMPDGIHHDNSWVAEFTAALEERGVRYVDNTGMLTERSRAGEAVFNRQYDSGHWNALGAFYGVNEILRAAAEEVPAVHINSLEEFDISETLVTSLPVSEFPIHEMIPAFTAKTEVQSRTGEFDGEVERNASYRGFGYLVNPERLAEGSPRALVFQGSYMNGQGVKFFANSLGEYIYVHNYQNVLNFDYYFNIFQPDCVIFEVTEYTFGSRYFDYQGMLDMRLNPPLDQAEAADREARALDRETLAVERGERLTRLRWTGGDGAEDCAWAVLGGAFDMRRDSEGAYEVTVMNEVWEEYGDGLEIVTQAGETLRVYSEA